MTGGELKEIKLPRSDNTASSLLLIAVRPSQVIFGRKFGDGAEVGKYEVRSKKGANGMSDIEGKVARGSRERVRATSKFQLRKLEKGAINSV